MKLLQTLKAILQCVKGNGKVKVFLCLTKCHAINMNWGSGCKAPRILDLGTKWR